MSWLLFWTLYPSYLETVPFSKTWHAVDTMTFQLAINFVLQSWSVADFGGFCFIELFFFDDD